MLYKKNIYENFFPIIKLLKHFQIYYDEGVNSKKGKQAHA